MEASFSLPIEEWPSALEPVTQHEAQAALEAGQVVVLPHLGFAIEPGEEGFLTGEALDGSRKNISFDPATGTVHGTTAAGAERERLGRMLDRFGRGAEALVLALAPGYLGFLERARTSFRPAEIAGREYAPRKDDRRLHVDAFSSRPTNGRRILRVFTNVATDGSTRDWRVGEPFESFAAAFLPRLRRPLPGQTQVMAWLGLTKGQRSLYDWLMLGLHDTAKFDAEYQAHAPASALSFPPGCTWLCFTDQVLHAAVAGHHALEQTFHLPVEAMAHPALAPLRVLERLQGHRLT
jgi:hypothetical protein